jgi:hypothetical protein
MRHCSSTHIERVTGTVQIGKQLTTLRAGGISDLLRSSWDDLESCLAAEVTLWLLFGVDKAVVSVPEGRTDSMDDSPCSSTRSAWPWWGT